MLHLSTLQEVWACWCELLAYLEQENAWMDLLEKRLDETENLQGGAKEIAEALAVSPWNLKHECFKSIKLGIYLYICSLDKTLWQATFYMLFFP